MCYSCLIKFYSTWFKKSSDSPYAIGVRLGCPLCRRSHPLTLYHSIYGHVVPCYSVKATEFVEKEENGDLSLQGILLATTLLTKKLQKRRIGLSVAVFPDVVHKDDGTYIEETTLYFLAVNKHLFPKPTNGKRWTMRAIVDAWRRIDPSDIIVVGAIATLKDPFFNASINEISYIVENEIIDLRVDLPKSLPVRNAVPFEAIVYQDEDEDLVVDVINLRQGTEPLVDESEPSRRRARLI